MNAADDPAMDMLVQTPQPVREAMQVSPAQPAAGGGERPLSPPPHSLAAAGLSFPPLGQNGAGFISGPRFMGSRDELGGECEEMEEDDTAMQLQDAAGSSSSALTTASSSDSRLSGLDDWNERVRRPSLAPLPLHLQQRRPAPPLAMPDDDPWWSGGGGETESWDWSRHNHEEDEEEEDGAFEMVADPHVAMRSLHLHPGDGYTNNLLPRTLSKMVTRVSTAASQVYRGRSKPQPAARSESTELAAMDLDDWGGEGEEGEKDPWLDRAGRHSRRYSDEEEDAEEEDDSEGWHRGGGRDFGYPLRQVQSPAGIPLTPAREPPPRGSSRLQQHPSAPDLARPRGNRTTRSPRSGTGSEWELQPRSERQRQRRQQSDKVSRHRQHMARSRSDNTLLYTDPLSVASRRPVRRHRGLPPTDDESVSVSIESLPPQPQEYVDPLYDSRKQTNRSPSTSGTSSRSRRPFRGPRDDYSTLDDSGDDEEQGYGHVAQPPPAHVLSMGRKRTSRHKPGAPHTWRTEKGNIVGRKLMGMPMERRSTARPPPRPKVPKKQNRRPLVYSPAVPPELRTRR